MAQSSGTLPNSGRVRGNHTLVNIAEQDGFVYMLFDGIVLIEEDTEDAHRESVRLTEEDAERLIVGMPVEQIRQLMYEYSPY